MALRQDKMSRGAATVEAVVALPVFVILFVGIVFVRDLAGARQLVDNEARRCAWQFAFQGCPSGGIAGCEGMFDTSDPVPIPQIPKFEGISESLEFDGKNTFYRAVQSVIEGVVKGWVSDALTKNFTANKTVPRERPGIFGGGVSQVTGTYRLACNLAPPVGKDESDPAYKKVWNAFKSAF